MTTQSKQKKIKGNRQKLKLFRSNDPLKSVLMWGINYSMSQLAHVKKRAVLMDEDFKSYLKVCVENHQFNKDYMPSHFKFKEYSPMVFIDLRRRFGVTDAQYLESFTSSPAVRMKKSPKKFSSMMLTSDRRFAVKIVSPEDVSFLQSWLADYHEHIVQNYDRTLLTQLLALYRLTVNDQDIYMIAINNMHYPPGDVSRLYLLEGIPDKSNEKEKKAASIDNDQTKWPTYNDARFVSDDVKMSISEQVRVELIKTLCIDMQFLDSCRIRYKLLFGLRDPEGLRYNFRDEQTTGGGGGGRPIYSEDEPDEEGSSPNDHKVSFDMGPDSDCEDFDRDAPSPSLPQGNTVGRYGIRDETDTNIIYYIGIVDIYRKRHHHSSSKERKFSMQTGINNTVTNVKGDNSRKESSTANPSDSSNFVQEMGSTGLTSSRQLSSRLLNVISQCMEQQQ